MPRLLRPERAVGGARPLSRAGRLLAWAGCGALPAAVFAAGALSTGAKTPWAALGLALAAAAAAAAPAPGGAGLAALALGAVLSAALVRLAGVWPALALAAAACAAGLLQSRAAKRPEEDGGPSWPAAAAAAALVAWARLLGLLAFDDLSVVAGLSAACAAAFAVGPALAAAVPRALLPAASAAAGLLGLAALRFIGLNAGEPERLQLPAAGLGDALFLGGQGLALSALWLIPAAGVCGSRRRAALWAAAGAAAGALGCAGFGPEAVALAAHAALGAAGLLGAARLRREWPVGSKLAAAALAVCALAAWPSRRLIHDVWLNRLNAAYPGGSYLAFGDDGSAARAAYRFASGAVVLLEDGVASHLASKSARRHLQIALLAHPSPKSVLLASPWAPTGPLAPYEARADLAMPGRGTDRLREALGSGAAPAASSDVRRLARRSPRKFDLIFAWSQPTTPLRREHTVEFLGELKRALADDGVLALELPPGTARASAFLRAAGEAAFKHSAAIDAEQGALAFFSDRPILLKQRVPLAVMAEEPEFAVESAGLFMKPLSDLVPDGTALTDRRAWAPVAASTNWYNP